MAGIDANAGQLDAAIGAFLGACTGDAAGAVLEFSQDASQGYVPLERVDWALSMPGGGVHAVGPGQITDDTELALCLAQGLVDSRPSDLPLEMPLESIAKMYAKWLDSRPFDVGFTCQRAFAKGSRALANGEPVAESILTMSKDLGSMASQANGALMRCSPLAIWIHRRPDVEIARCAAQEACLSHPNRVCQDTNAAYCLAIASLIRSPGDGDKAVEAAERWVDQNAAPDVQRWLKEALGGAPFPAVAGNGTDGWVRWAFTLSFRHLKLKSSFEDAIKDSLSRGGDVDTNTAIVGGLIGALNGASKIPSKWKDTVLSRNVHSQGQKRPGFLTSDQERPGSHVAAAPYACRQYLS